MHYLTGVKAAGTTETMAVAAKMHATPVNDFYNSNVTIRQDGRVMHQMYLWQVKPASEARSEVTDFCKNLAVIKPADAWRPLSEGGCPYVKA